jgi:hypothetical protein
VNEIKWLALEVVVAVHEAQLAEHGGSEGTRDAGLLESALARPQNLLAYGNLDIADLAAAYGFGSSGSRVGDFGVDQSSESMQVRTFSRRYSSSRRP